MNPLDSVLIEKAGYDNGFENSQRLEDQTIVLSSARHGTRAEVRLAGTGYQVCLLHSLQGLEQELARDFGEPMENAGFVCVTEAGLHGFLRRTAALSRALPNQALRDYEKRLEKALAALTPEQKTTEVERLVRQRLGQDRYRSAMLEYWGGACAVTGLALPEVLRASHAKPWADCASDAERLDVFNGFLLCAQLDALFDRFLISFDDQGRLLLSPALQGLDLSLLGIRDGMRLRWLDVRHLPWLALHRARLFQLSDSAV